MSKTVIQAELPPELVTLARNFVSQSGLTDLNGLLEEALQDFFKHHTPAAPNRSTDVDRQRIFRALADQAESCAQRGWDGHGAEPVSLETCRFANRLVEMLPHGCPLPGVGAEPDGHVTLEWYRSPSQVLSVSVSPDGVLNYAALLGDTSRRTGSEIFHNRVPADLLHLIHEIFAA